jgi:hypothetical protein
LLDIRVLNQYCQTKLLTLDQMLDEIKFPHESFFAYVEHFLSWN